MTIVVIDRQPSGVSKPKPPAGLLGDPDRDVVAGVSPGEMGAGETGGGKLGGKGVEAEGLGSAVESVQEVILPGLEPAARELVDSLAGPSGEADVEKFQPLLGTDEKGPRDGPVGAGDGEPDSSEFGAPEDDGAKVVLGVVLGARLEFAPLSPDS